MISRLFSALLVGILACVAAQAGSAPFDLAGPVLEVKITRGTTTLPASQVPNLAAGDRLWIKADLPPSQSAHYLLVSAFLRGSTNPPPESWFLACKTWTERCGREGMNVTVPADAGQMMVFLAPKTGGDYRTLLDAVRGRPGAFVRTSQDLNQATLDRSRLEAYLVAIRSFNDTDPAKLAQITPLLARSLAIKIDDKCLDRAPDLQAPCLMAGGESLILNDGHSTSIVEALTSGPGADLAMEASYTPQLSYGYYSPYLASVLDIARILDSFHTAQYQYIPALASPHGDQLRLTLNAAPSFHNPKSVLVAALPAVEQAQPPPLHAVDPKEIYCARKTALVLPVDGAPLVFATAYAHDMTLSLTGKDGKGLELPAVADAARGGFVVDTSGLGTGVLGDSVQATLKGSWGFDAYHGPSFRLMNAHGTSFALATGEASGLIVGRQDTVHLRSDNVSCVDGILLKDPAGKELKVDWKPLKADEVEVKLPLQETPPGALTLFVSQYGVSQPAPVAVQAFSEAGHFDGFSMHAGDTTGLLKGTRLDEVASLSIKNVQFTPGELSSKQGTDELSLVAVDSQAAAAFKPERAVAARITLKDGRVLPLTAAIDAPRPRVSLLGKSIEPGASESASNIELGDADELPQGATLVFSLRTQSPSTFTRDASIEVATVDDSADALLTLGGGLALENSQVAVATLSPAKLFAGAFGPLKFRVVTKTAVGDWQPLATLVRLPVLQGLRCPPTSDLACKLTGSDLYLLDSVSGDPQFKAPVQVPEGFLGSALPVPHPTAGSLYIKLRDDPQIVNAATLVSQDMPAVAGEADRTAVRQSALRSDSAPASP
jgi:hypothetical protein